MAERTIIVESGVGTLRYIAETKQWNPVKPAQAEALLGHIEQLEAKVAQLEAKIAKKKQPRSARSGS